MKTEILDKEDNDIPDQRQTISFSGIESFRLRIGT